MEWKELRQELLNRANDRCETCGVPNRALVCRLRADPAAYLLLDDLFASEGEDPPWEEYGETIKIVLVATTKSAEARMLCQRCYFLHERQAHGQSRRARQIRRVGQKLLPLEG